MTKIETNFTMTLACLSLMYALGTSVCEMASQRLKIAPEKCRPLDGVGFQWIETSPTHSPTDRHAYIQDILRRRLRYLEITPWGILYEMDSCSITIDGVRFDYSLECGSWVKSSLNQCVNAIS